MYKKYRLYWAVVLGLGSTAPVLAEDVIVISHPEVLLASEDIRDVFLGEKQFAGSVKQFAGSVKIVPVDNRAAQGVFLSKVVKIDNTRYNTTWAKKGFRDGLAQPVVKSGDAEVINFVKSTPGAVGYVTAESRDIKVIQKY